MLFTFTSRLIVPVKLPLLLPAQYTTPTLCHTRFLPTMTPPPHVALFSIPWT
jgi:hypothetical protein